MVGVQDFWRYAYKIEKIQIEQNTAMRLILKCNNYTPVNCVLNISNTALIIFKIKQILLPQNLGVRTNVFINIHSYKTQN